LLAAFRASLEKARRDLGANAARVEALSPLGVLARGFAVARRSDGSIVRDVATLAVGEELGLRFARGTARAQVLETVPEPTDRLRSAPTSTQRGKRRRE
jgi:exodeoxyribonuclease VII large subunit